MKIFNEFLNNWSNTVSFFMQLLAVIVNIVLAFLVFCIGQKSLKKNDKNCFESIIREMGEQFGFMYKLCNFFSKNKQVMNKIIEGKKEGSFLALLWDFRHEANTVWVTLPLHKFKQYRHLFDNYSKNTKMTIYNQKINIHDLNSEILQIISYLKEAVAIQEHMKTYFSSMNELVIFHNQNKKEIKKIIEKMDNTLYYNDFRTYLDDNKIDWCIDWEHSEKLWLEFMETIENYVNNEKKAIEFTKNSDTLSILQQWYIF